MSAAHCLPLPRSGNCLDRCRSLLEGPLGGMRAEFASHSLSSAFQPIFGLSHRRAVGFEALLRAEMSGRPVSPLQVFDKTDGSETVFLDRLSRAMHAFNFRALNAPEAWLFLNIRPQVVIEGRVHGPFFAALLERAEILPQQVVVEILESAIQDEARLAESVEFYRNLGCLVAIDDFGAGHSNFERIARLRPDIVKLDRSLVCQATRGGWGSSLLPNLVELLHELGCLVVLEGIETEEQALIAMEADADFVQGYYFARPMAPAPQTGQGQAQFSALSDQFRLITEADDRHRETLIAEYALGFEHAAASYAAGADLDVACYRLINRPRVVRCYVLDTRGIQVGRNLRNQIEHFENDPRFLPLYDTAGVDWSRKHYFRRAVATPGRIQSSRPYLSTTGAHMCVTFSMSLQRDGETEVLCCDLDWSD